MLEQIGGDDSRRFDNNLNRQIANPSASGRDDQRLGEQSIFDSYHQRRDDKLSKLYWTPVLANPDYPWQVIAVGTNGATNFEVNAGAYSAGFFKAQVEQIYNGVPDYEMADPNNPSLGALTVTIDSPANGSVVQ